MTIVLTIVMTIVITIIVTIDLTIVLHRARQHKKDNLNSVFLCKTIVMTID